MGTKAKLENWEKKAAAKKTVTKKKVAAHAKKRVRVRAARVAPKRKYRKRAKPSVVAAQDGEMLSFNVPVQLYLRFPRIQQVG